MPDITGHTPARTPTGLGKRGRQLWRDIAADVDLDAAQRVMLHEACRGVDRLDRLDAVLIGDEQTWLTIKLPREGAEDQPLEVHVDGALAEARQQQNIVKQLLVALRLPDVAGRVPQRRGAARGAYREGSAGTRRPAASGGAPAPVSAIERARAARAARASG